MTKRNVPPADTWLVDYRESAGLTPPPRTLSNAATRLIDLLDEFLYSLRCGWEIPPEFPRDRFVPTVYGKRDLVVPIVQYLVDLGFTGDALRLHEATRRFCEHLDWRLMTPSPGDDKGWKEFQERYVGPLWDKGARLQGVICDVRQLIIDMGSKGSRVSAAGDETTPIHASTDEAPANYRRAGESDGDPIGPVVGTRTALGYALHNNEDLSDQAYRVHFKRAIASGSAWARKCASATNRIELFLPSFRRRDEVAERLELFHQRESQRKQTKANESKRNSTQVICPERTPNGCDPSVSAAARTVSILKTAA